MRETFVHFLCPGGPVCGGCFPGVSVDAQRFEVALAGVFVPLLWASGRSLPCHQLTVPENAVTKHHFFSVSCCIHKHSRRRWCGQVVKGTGLWMKRFQQHSSPSPSLPLLLGVVGSREGIGSQLCFLFSNVCVRACVVCVCLCEPCVYVHAYVHTFVIID